MYTYRILTASTFEITADKYKAVFNGDEATAIAQTDKMNLDVLNRAKDVLLKEVREYYSEIYGSYLKEYSTNEQATFPKQETEYEAWALDNTIPTPTVDRLAVARKVDRVILLEKIGANIIIRDTMTGEQQAMEDAIKVCTSLAELEAL